MKNAFSNHGRLTLVQKVTHLHWFFILLLCVVASIGFGMLFSAGNGSFDPWASRQMVRFAIGLIAMVAIAVTDVRIWMRYAYVFYGLCLLLLLMVEYGGYIGMGAQRWVRIGFVTIQPSELMKITLILALARYFHSLGAEDVRRPLYLLPPILLIAAPVVLVLRQPDLGTAIMLAMASAVIFFTAGVRMWKFVVVGIGGLASLPIAWQFLHDYQKKRVLTFLNPEQDALGSGYHIIQSKIALGSGGVFGKGFLQGTQGHLNFLPEKQTDFIFTMLAEEMGLVGGLVLLGLYIIIIAYGFAMSLASRSQFGRLTGIGITSTFFLYVFINIAMVMGLVPVVGVPLPLISYGGTALMTLMFGFGLLLSVHVHRETTMGLRGGAID